MPVAQGTGLGKPPPGEEVDEEELAMMGGCYEAPLNAMVRGGKVVWQGDGVWVPESV